MSALDEGKAVSDYWTPTAEGLVPGDYVLATKYGDGDPGDHWAVGFYDGKTWHDRYLVIDNDGKQFRRNGFRRISKISAKRGEFLVKHIPIIEESSRSLWWWKRTSMNIDAMSEAA